LNTCKSLDDAHLLQKAILKSQKTGGLSDTAQNLTQRIHDKETELIHELVTRETSNVMELCGLASTATAWKNFQQASAEHGGALYEALAAYPGLSPYEVQEAVKEFYSSLYSPPLPSLETVIKDPVVRKAARRQIAQRVCTFYAELYEAIMAAHAGESGGYEDVAFLGHTPEQVTTLFSA
jgi:conserved oligomeric Golgi complex subunit 6